MNKRIYVDVIVVWVLLMTALSLSLKDNTVTGLVISQEIDLPSNYGAPYDVFDPSHPQIFGASYSDGNLIVSTEAPYTWEEAHYWDYSTGGYQPITLSGNKVGNWIKDEAYGSAPVDISSLQSSGMNFVIAYTCKKISGVWECGCRNAADCNMWQIQTFDAYAAICGNPWIEGSEQCDCGSDEVCTPAELNNKNCRDLGYTGGTLGCYPPLSSSKCQYDIRGCTGKITYSCDGAIHTCSESSSGTYYSLEECNNECKLPIKCTDSDAGKDYYNNGYVRVEYMGGTYTDTYDTCSSATDLYEMYCSGISSIKEVYTCSSGCSNGECNPQITITTASLPSGSVSIYYSQYLEASGGKIPYTWSIETGSLPPGLSITTENNRGKIYGTPTTDGTYSTVFKVTDPSLQEVTKSLQIRIYPKPQCSTTNPCPTGQTCVSGTCMSCPSSIGTCDSSTTCDVKSCIGTSYYCRSIEHGSYNWMTASDFASSCNEQTECSKTAECSGVTKMCLYAQNKWGWYDPSIINTDNDFYNCGYLCEPCTSGQVCVGGNCQAPSCSTSLGTCNAATPCTPRICSGINYYCRSINGGPYTWISASTLSSYTCTQQTDCGQTRKCSSITEKCLYAQGIWSWYSGYIDLYIDENNCGQYCNVCDSGQTCNAGECKLPCPEDLGDCNNQITCEPVKCSDGYDYYCRSVAGGPYWWSTKSQFDASNPCNQQGQCGKKIAECGGFEFMCLYANPGTGYAWDWYKWNEVTRGDDYNCAGLCDACISPQTCIGGACT